MPGGPALRLTIVHPCIGRRRGEPYIRTWQMEPLAAAVLAGATRKGRIVIRTKRCPACQRENAIIDLHCDCGRNFATGQHDLLYGVRAGRVEATWPIPGRGYRRIELDAAMLTARIGGD